MRRKLDDRDLASEAAIHLRKFEPHIAPAEHDEVRRQKIHIHHGAVGEVRDLIESWDGRYYRPAAHVDENLVGSESLITDLHALRSDEAAVTFQHRTSFQLLQRSLDPLARRERNGVLARLHRLHIHADATADGPAV